MKVRRVLKDKAKYFGPYTNVGAVNGTHSSKGSISSNIPSNELKFPLKHPAFIICNIAYDKYHIRSRHISFLMHNFSLLE